MTALLAGLAFGLVGSGHCATMCGPLVMLANPRAAGLGTHPACFPRRMAGHAALYHGGRASTYIALGALVGLAGGALTHLGFGRALAVFAGVALVLQAVAATGIVHWPAGVTETRERGLACARSCRHLDALAPCAGTGGVRGAQRVAAVWLALCGTHRRRRLRHVGQSMIFMGCFAVGTTPVLAVIAMAGGSLTARVPHVVRRATPAALAIVGVLLIARGVRAPHEAHGAHATGAATITHTHPH